jgi:putative sigma-54 modulation protein
MQLHVKGRNLEVNDSIRRYAERKLGKLDRTLKDSTRVEVELAVERNPSISESQVAEATIWLKGHTVRAREASADMKAAIDELVDKLIRQVKDAHDKRVSRRKHPGLPPPETEPDAATSEI